jgi:hypothetical protein
VVNVEQARTPAIMWLPTLMMVLLHLLSEPRVGRLLA